MVAVLALLAATVVVVARGDGGDGGDDVAGGAPTTETTSDPGASSTSPTTAPAEEEVTEAELRALIEELQAYVAEARGLEYQREVVVELAGDDEFEARLLEDFEEDIGEIEDVEVFYRALGLLDPDTSLLDELRSIYSAGVLGFYDPETDELVVRGLTATPYVRKTIVHELVHALDDQHFELHREQYDEEKDEIATGFSAVVEGNARRIEQAWIEEQPADVQQRAAAEERAFADGIDIDAFPEILLFEIGAPYEFGTNLVNALHADGGERAIDGALTDPPRTSEQVLMPPLYEAREPRVEVPVPPADGEVVDDGVVGALFWLGLLTTGDSQVPVDDAVAAVRGWGGDWAVTWEDGDADCVRVDVVGDTDRDTDEIEQALTAWAEGSEAAQVTTVDGRVRMESCVGGAGATPPQV